MFSQKREQEKNRSDLSCRESELSNPKGEEGGEKESLKQNESSSQSTCRFQKKREKK
jgi:hypothetical protein